MRVEQIARFTLCFCPQGGENSRKFLNLPVLPRSVSGKPIFADSAPRLVSSVAFGAFRRFSLHFRLSGGGNAVRFPAGKFLQIVSPACGLFFAELVPLSLTRRYSLRAVLPFGPPAFRRTDFRS